MPSRNIRSYPAKVLSVHDGDTIWLDIDVGFYMSLREKIRFARINTPELPTPDGKAATERLRELLPVGSTVRFDCYGKDKYGRWLGDVVMADGRMANDVMMLEGMAKAYAD